MKRQRLNHNTETPTNTYTDMALFDRLTQRARENRQRIVLPEGTEPRTLKAADQILAEGLADIILIGSETEIKRMAAELNLANIIRATIVDPSD